MRGSMKVKGRLAFFVCIAAAFLGGCDGTDVPDVIDSPTVSVREDGQITYWLVGEFDKDYYEITELTEMAKEEVDTFNEGHGTDSGYVAVSVKKVEALEDESGTVVVTYLIDGWKSFREFTAATLFYGNVAEATENAFETDVALRTVKDDSTLKLEEIKQVSEKQLIITDVKSTVYCPGKVTHLSEGAMLNKDGSVDTSGAEGLVYILMK